jgi:hypothetical protein
MRVDAFAGLSAANANKLQNVSKERRHRAVEYAFSEISFHPTLWAMDEFREEAARLLMAGYKFGNYKAVPNTEVLKTCLQGNWTSCDHGVRWLKRGL